MIKRLRLYRLAIIEIMETLCSICLYLERDGHFCHNPYAADMYDHTVWLKKLSEELKGAKK